VRSNITVASTRQWRRWLRRLARHTKTTVSGALVRGVRMVAAEVGFTEPEPQRLLVEPGPARSGFAGSFGEEVASEPS
jgi:hypothetical protein